MTIRREYIISGNEAGKISVFAETVTKPTKRVIIKLEVTKGPESINGLLQLAKQMVEIVETEDTNDREDKS